MCCGQAGGGSCIADAVRVESAARYNDGSAADNVTLQPMDAIVLRRTLGAPAQCSAAAVGVRGELGGKESEGISDIYREG